MKQQTYTEGTTVKLTVSLCLPGETDKPTASFDHCGETPFGPYIQGLRRPRRIVGKRRQEDPYYSRKSMFKAL